MSLTHIPAAKGDGTYWISSGMSVVFLQVWTAVPIFHEPQRIAYNGYAVCGVDLWHRRNGGYYAAKGEWIPVKHAVKFGRPCKHCYP